MAKRQRWSAKTHTDGKREALRKSARDLIVKTIASTDEVITVRGISLQRGVDLRASLEEKALFVSPHTNWTAYVNNAGTLCHMVPKEGDMHLRIPLYYSTNILSDGRLLAMLHKHVGHRIA
jgi:hypothetical protein